MYNKAPLPSPPNIQVGDHVILSRGKTGIIQFIGKTRFSASQDVIGIKLDRYHPDAHDGKGYFNTPNGRGYFVRKENLSNIVLPSNKTNHEDKRNTILAIKNQLRELEILEFKHKSALIINFKNPLKRIAKLERKIYGSTRMYVEGVSFYQLDAALWSAKDSLRQTLRSLCVQSENDSKPSNYNIKFKFDIICRHIGKCWTGKYWLPPPICPNINCLKIEDIVFVSNGMTGVVKYIGSLPFLHEAMECEHSAELLINGYFNRFNQASLMLIPVEVINLCVLYYYAVFDNPNMVIGLVLDQWHPSYGDGTIDNIRYFDCADGRAYFAHSWEFLGLYSEIMKCV